MKTILLATDGSPSAERATDEAIALAAATGWPLSVVTVWNMPIVTGYGYAPYPLPRELADAEREHAQEVAAAAVARAADAGLDATFELRTAAARHGARRYIESSTPRGAGSIPPGPPYEHSDSGHREEKQRENSKNEIFGRFRHV